MKTLVTKGIGLYLNTLSWIAPEKAGRVGFELFCRPFRGKISPQHKAFFASADQFTITHKGEKIQLYKWGQGEKKIMFVHGWQSHTYRWKKYIEELNKEEFTIYSIDAPGHGLSSGKFMSLPLYSEVVEKAIRQLGKMDAVISHSIGGFTSIYTFYTHADLTPKKLVALASPGEVREFFDFYKAQLSLSERTLARILTHFKKEIGATPDFFSASKFASTLTNQGLLIHDEEDNETSVDNSKAIHQNWKNSILIVTKGKGHNLRSEEVASQVIKFVSDIQDEPQTVFQASVSNSY